MPAGPGQIGINPDGTVANVSVVTLAQPAAGADFGPYTLPAARMLVAINGQLVTSAVVASRVPRLRFALPGGVILMDSPATVGQAASLTNRFMWFQGAISVGNGGEITSPLPMNFVLPAGGIISMSTANIDVGDQWTAFELSFAGP